MLYVIFKAIITTSISAMLLITILTKLYDTTCVILKQTYSLSGQNRPIVGKAKKTYSLSE